MNLRFLHRIMLVTLTLSLGAVLSISACAQDVPTVHLVDPPALTIPADVVVTMTSISGTKVNLGQAVVTDTADPAPKVTNDAPALFLLGTTEVTWTAENSFGISVSAVQRVTVLAPTEKPAPPTLTVPANITAEQTGKDGASVNIGQATAVDCTGKALTVTNDAPATFKTGATTVTWTTKDGYGNVIAMTQLVTVKDTTAPKLTLPAKMTVEQTSAKGAIVAYAVTATDTCDANPVIACTPASGNTFPAGATTVTVTATDAAGNKATDTFTVTVQDTTAPLLTQPANMNVEQTAANGAVAGFVVAASDACDANPIVTCSPASGSVFAPGTTTVLASATDAAGNKATGTFTVTVKDTTAPTLTLPANIAVEQNAPQGTVVTFTATATDSVTTAPTVTCAPASGSTFPAGVTTVTVTATDAAGNKATGTFTVTVKDTTAPKLTVPADITTAQQNANGTAVTLGQATATDACDVSPKITNNAPSLFPVGTTVVTWTATDAAGNKATATQKVTITPMPACTLVINKITLDWKQQGQMLTSPTLTLNGQVNTPAGGPGKTTTVTVQFTFGGVTSTRALSITWSAGASTSFALNCTLDDGTLPNGNNLATLTMTLPAELGGGQISTSVTGRQVGNHQWKYN